MYTKIIKTTGENPFSDGNNKLLMLNQQLKERLGLDEMNYPVNQTSKLRDGFIVFNNVKASIVTIGGLPLFNGRFEVFADESLQILKFSGSFDKGFFNAPVIQYGFDTRGHHKIIGKIEIVDNKIVETPED